MSGAWFWLRISLIAGILAGCTALIAEANREKKKKRKYARSEFAILRKILRDLHLEEHRGIPQDWISWIREAKRVDRLYREQVGRLSPPDSCEEYIRQRLPVGVKL